MLSVYYRICYDKMHILYYQSFQNYMYCKIYFHKRKENVKYKHETSFFSAVESVKMKVFIHMPQQLETEGAEGLTPTKIE